MITVFKIDSVLMRNQRPVRFNQPSVIWGLTAEPETDPRILDSKDLSALRCYRVCSKTSEESLIEGSKLVFGAVLLPTTIHMQHECLRINNFMKFEAQKKNKGREMNTSEGSQIMLPRNLILRFKK